KISAARPCSSAAANPEGSSSRPGSSGPALGWTSRSGSFCFDHDVNAATPENLKNLPTWAKKQVLKSIVCRHYAAGNCSKGAQCRFKHPSAEELEVHKAEQAKLEAAKEEAERKDEGEQKKGEGDVEKNEKDQKAQAEKNEGEDKKEETVADDKKEETVEDGSKACTTLKTGDDAPASPNGKKD
ncbi:unnamed protein product, partial [Amoebophrya sp. A25]